MKCLRCQSEMKQYRVQASIKILEPETNKKYEIGNTVQTVHTPQSAYVCDNCGCIEFSKNSCDN